MSQPLSAAAFLPIAFLTLTLQAANAQQLASAAKPQLGAFGIDTTAKDPAVRPGDDFNRYANGSWLKVDRIPADRARYGSFDILREQSEQRTRAILEEAARSEAAPGTVERKIGDFYRSFMDEAGVEALGTAPIKAELERIAAIGTRDDIHAYLVHASNAGNRIPIGIGVWLDEKDANQYVVSISQAGLGLPDRDYYFNEQPRSVEIRAKYLAHIARLFELAGIAGGPAKAKAVFDLEKSLAAGHWTRVESRDRSRTYNPRSLAELAAMAPEFPWAKFLAETRLDARPVYVVRQTTAVSATAKVLAEAPVATLRDYFAFHAIADAAPYLGKALAEERFAFAGRTLEGTPEMPPRWRRAVMAVDQAMGEGVGQIWVRRHFPPESKARMEKLVANIKLAMARRIDGLDWMSDETKREARAKLAGFNTKIGYPDKWRDYAKLDVRPDDLYGNVRRAAIFALERTRGRLGSPTDRGEWNMAPQVVNAYYNAVFNEIVFPAAILQPPFFDPAADDAVNYGAIGGVIGHEIGHGFDDQGRKYDAKGMLRDWWTAEDDKRFRARSDRLVAQYSGYCPLGPAGCINGRQSLGENIGDLGGIQMAYEAYRLSLDGKPAPVIEGYTGDQRFFLSWAQIWRSQQRDAALRAQMIAGTHSPGAYRVNGVVRNVDAWYAAFGVKPGDQLYLPPEERVRIW
jgi:putative endopeptidase